jgi:S-DNA-T family DNA segregation ATPase FtsK/SpoIIIE
MDLRYNLLKAAGVRNIAEYNAKFISRRLNPNDGHRFLPYIVLVIDEFADLIMTAGKEVELPIARLAQLARAVGIHLIVATQRPSTNIITGTIKANFPTRLAFKVASMVDSRTILDMPGANQLIGRGDMLITQGSEIIRLQCAFIDTKEIDKITDYIGSQQAYPTPYLLPEFSNDNESGIGSVDLENRDDLFEDAARIVVLHQQGSTSLIQRKLSIGYNRAGRIIDQLEAAGVVGAFEGSKARQVLISDEHSLENFLSSLR